MIQILSLIDLAGSMPLDGKLGVIGCHSKTIIRHPNQALSAMLNIDLDCISSGVKGILDQLLDNGSRPLDHFSRGDLVGHDLRQYVDFTHEFFRSREVFSSSPRSFEAPPSA